MKELMYCPIVQSSEWFEWIRAFLPPIVAAVIAWGLATMHARQLRMAARNTIITFKAELLGIMAGLQSEESLKPSTWEETIVNLEGILDLAKVAEQHVFAYDSNRFRAFSSMRRYAQRCATDLRLNLDEYYKTLDAVNEDTMPFEALQDVHNVAIQSRNTHIKFYVDKISKISLIPYRSRVGRMKNWIASALK